jgi:hypothetical protein
LQNHHLLIATAFQIMPGRILWLKNLNHSKKDLNLGNAQEDTRKI